MTQTRLPFDVYLDHLEADSARFAEVLEGADQHAKVPACPEWTAFDLAYHLAEVQHSWTQIVSRRLATDEQAGAIEKPARPEHYADCVALVREHSDLLLQALRSTAPETPAWTWSTEQSVGFTYRRQAHEALIHRLDAEQVAGTCTPLPAALSADGVDEILRIMYGGCPPWGTITPTPGRTVRLRSTDTGDSWLVTLATFTGRRTRRRPHRGTRHPHRRLRRRLRRAGHDHRHCRGPRRLAVAPRRRRRDRVRGRRGGAGRVPPGRRPGRQLTGPLSRPSSGCLGARARPSRFGHGSSRRPGRAWARGPARSSGRR